MTDFLDEPPLYEFGALQKRKKRTKSSPALASVCVQRRKL